jgi:Ribonuclease G/E
MSSSIVAKISEYLGLSTEEVERRALRYLILDELRRVKAEKVLILSKYGVRSFEDLMRLVEEDKVSDVNAHDDIIRLDYLEDREKELENLLEELEVMLTCRRG